MKKSLFLGLVAILCLIGCTRNQELDIQEHGLTLFARTESPAESRTVVESGVHVYWEPGDEIAVFMGEKSAKFTTDITAASGTATFKGTFGDTTWPEEPDLWAVYPYSEDAVFDGETITTVLPSEQVAREASFGKDMNLAIAHSSGTALQFYNIGGGIRFSVTEEGIKKVLFEGLGGEIISGKVKVGFENDVPKVKEVTDGSQFITLLPPYGKETFEKDTWYYIVAIPSSLESGYKLRFYKDSDYARKVSEKAVVIKRSIFGSLDKADYGIEYEAKTTKFPETEEEWKTSIALTERISNEIRPLIDSFQDNDLDLESTLSSFLRVEGVINATINTDSSAVIVMQSDSVCINFLIRSIITNDIEYPMTSMTNLPKQMTRTETKRTPLLEDNCFISSGNKALILAPFHHEFKEPLEEWADTLKTCLGNNSVDIIFDGDADLSRFEEDFLGRYGFVLISTHGIWGYCQKPTLSLGDYAHFDNWHNRYCLCTGSKYTAMEIKRLESLGIKPEDRCVTWHKGKVYLCVTPGFYNSYGFENSAIVLSACNSASEQGEDSIVDSFLLNGARIVSGTLTEVNSEADRIYNSMIINYLSNGLSFQSSFKYIMSSEKTLKAIQAMSAYKSFGSYSSLNIVQNYRLSINYGLGNQDFFIKNPFPYNLRQSLDNNCFRFYWDCELTPFKVWWPDRLEAKSDRSFVWYNQDYFYDIRYDLYVDDTLVVPNIHGNDTTWCVSLAEKPNSWHVVASILEGEKVIDSFQSNQTAFCNPPNPEVFVDLGLSVKWASFNLDASTYEEAGGNYAWGETETKSRYTWGTYKWSMDPDANIFDYRTSSLTKYCFLQGQGFNGFIDGKGVLESQDDVVHRRYGEGYRMPTKEELLELVNNCQIERIKKGYYQFTSTVPGFTDKWIIVTGGGGTCCEFTPGIWSSTLDSSDSNKAWCLTVKDYSTPKLKERERFWGLNIRPVCEK